MATRNSSEVARRRLRVRRARTKVRPRTDASYAASLPRQGGRTRASGAPSVKRALQSARSPARRWLPRVATPIMPSAIQAAIDKQRGELATAMTVLHCPHCVLRREPDHTNPDEGAEFEDAVGWVELPKVTAMLLVRLHAIHLALDSVSLRQALEASES